MAERSTSQLVGATLIGGAVGAGLALLFAPQSGKETRDRIHQNYDHLKQGAQDRGREAKDRLSRAVHSTGKKARSEMEELKDKTERKTRRQSPVLSAWEEEV